MADSVNRGTPQPQSALFTDLYQLTMGQAYWQSGQMAGATFSLFFRSYPEDRGYYIFVGLEDVLAFLEDMRFSADDIEYLRGQGQFSDGFLEYLSGLRFTGSVRAMPEGSIFFANEPVIEVTGPVIEAQIAETLLLNQVSVQSILATKASKVVRAAKGNEVVDYGARRSHGADAGLKFARASYIAGYAGTSLVQAGKAFGIPIFGTMAHSFITSFPKEIDAFRAYADAFPNTSSLLVDTFSTIAGARKAIEVGLEMRRRGYELRGIRLDSGDLVDLSKRARSMLDEAGLGSVRIFASGGLDEFEIDRLVSEGAAIDIFGVGTKVNVSADAPWLDTVYKLVEYDGRPVLKLSKNKQTLPGAKQVYRRRDAEGLSPEDVIALADEATPPREVSPLLTEVMRDGMRTGPAADLRDLRKRCAAELAELPEPYKALMSPARYPVSISARLENLRDRLASEAVIREA